MHYYKFNISDWHLATSHLSLEEEAVYFKLVNYYYDTERPIPLETQSVIRRLRLGNHLETFAQVLEEFFNLKADGWHHERCDDEIEKYHHKAEINQKVGKLGGRPKKINKLDFNPQLTEMVFENNPQKTLTTNHKPITTNHNKNITPIGFDLFWDSYGKKVGKPKALKEWLKLKPSAQLLDKICEMAEKDKAAKPDVKFRKDPERWLKYRGWEDELIAHEPAVKELPLGTDAQIEAAYRAECGDPTKARFQTYYEMRNFIIAQREKRKAA